MLLGRRGGVGHLGGLAADQRLSLIDPAGALVSPCLTSLSLCRVPESLRRARPVVLDCQGHLISQNVSLIGFRKSTPPQNHRLIVYYY